MKAIGLFGLFLVTASLVGGFPVSAGGKESPANAYPRNRLLQTYNDGNYRDAYEGYRKLALDPKDDPRLVGGDLETAIRCLQQLNRVDEIDELREAVVKVHGDNWRLLQAVARSYMNVPHQGFMVAGQFARGDKRGGGEVMNAVERDRVRALQLMRQGMAAVVKEADWREAPGYFFPFAKLLLGERGGADAWRLQTLTNLNVLPDYAPGWGHDYEPAAGSPVDDQGKPLFYSSPKSFDSATSDGERWRWCLTTVMELDSSSRNAARMELANFLQEQFGVQTITEFGWRFDRMESDDMKEDESGTYALHTLGENETIARLATGIKRFTLPDEFNFIKIYQEVADDSSTRSGAGARALEQLAEIFENRRQYPRAAEYVHRLIDVWREAGDSNLVKNWQRRLDQIIGNWGQFEPVMSQPAGKGATVEYRFRNGRRVEFTAHEIHIEKLLDDVKAYLKSNPSQLDWEKINIDNIGYRLVEKNEKQYLGREVASWEMALEPRDKHFDKRVTVTTPLVKPGAYLVKAKMADGNISQIILWLNDTTIVKKPLAKKAYYFVADAVTGKPIEHANVEFFGFQQKQERSGGNRFRVETTEFAEYTDADGQVMAGPADQATNYQWLITTRTPEGRFAHLGFTNVWYGRYYDQEYKATKVYTITDRPVYRPKQTVQYKFWVRHAQYDMRDASEFAGRDFAIEIVNPKGERIEKKSLKADEYGGMIGKLELPEDAALGVYRFEVKDGKKTLGGGNFRVEEYKKPEFEVTIDAPAEPVMLGEKITATIKAKYYFGSPVTHAKVKYKVLRTDHTERWYPVGPWDWLYGPGYWWFGYDSDWYPGWRDWGCRRPMPIWWHGNQAPPEVVVQREVEIGPDGTVKVEIDTAVAKAIHPDKDHSYAITAEVVDQSRRTIVGSGNVLVARKPFTVNAWVDRGYYRVGDVIHADFAARTLDGKGVAGKGKLALLKITYKDGKPVETPVQTWDVATSDEGRAEQQLTASQGGQYRLSYKLTDAKLHTIEGGYLFTIIGQGFDSAQFRFNHIEVIPDRREYKPGEQVSLQINTDRPGSTVLLFLRPTNGVYLPPKVLRMDGKSMVQEITVAAKDMPNFFVEAVTVADGQVYTETREIVVPPEKRVLSVDIEPSSGTYRPGQKAKVKVKLTDFFGKPFVGSTVIAIYDKSVEYISGGSNVPEIKDFFWKWRRRHNPQTESNLGEWFQNLVMPNTPAMEDLGVFGGTVAEELDEANQAQMEQEGIKRRMAPGMAGGMAGGMGGGGFGGGREMLKAAMPMAAPMAADTAMREVTVGMKAQEALAEPTAPMVQPTVRTNFADTALWVGQLTTEANGTAEVELAMPENLTTWRIKVWGMGHGTKVGQGQTDVVTRKDLILRMQTPRFFVQTDEVVLSANVHNYLKSEKAVRVALELDGKQLSLVDENKGASGSLSAAAIKPTPKALHKTAQGWSSGAAAWPTLGYRAQNHDFDPNGVAETVAEPFQGSPVDLNLQPRVAAAPQPWAILRNRFAVGVLGSLQLVYNIEAGAPGGNDLIQEVHIAPNGEARVDWRVKVNDEGEAVVRMKALTDEESDAMEMRIPCYVHGMLKTDSFSGAIRPDEQTGQFTINVPKDRRPEQSRLELRYSPTLAGAMVDALPYLVEYPYGCTEQTLSRFLPSVITQKVLLGMKLDLDDIRKKRINLNAQEIGDDQKRAEGWKRYKRNPVFDQAEVQRMVKDGVKALTEMQVSDGGWGWFSGWGERSYPHTTAYVVHGLQIAQQNDVALVPGVLERGVAWLTRYQNGQVRELQNAKDDPKNAKKRPWKSTADNLDAFVYMALVDAGVKNDAMQEFLYRDRTKLSVYGMAMLGLALEKQGDREELDMILQNIGQYVVEDNENQTAWLKLPEGYWWCWYGDEIEAEAYYLKLLSRTEPKGRLASRLVKYLLNNRKNATYWNSTRDTALCVEAMADYLRASGEDRPEMTVEILVDGKSQKAVEITPANLFAFDNKLVIEGKDLTDGPHKIEIKKTGRGPLYFNAYQTNFTLEDFIKRSGLEIKVNRKYYRLKPVDKTVKAAGSHGQAVDQKVEKFDREELANLAMLKSGELVEIELEIDSKNDYEYLVFEDMKPAGFEPVDLQSGYTDNALGAYMEFRDNRVVFFVRELARGKHSVAYRMRAETPGRFSSLPTKAAAMYAPELKANSDEIKLRVGER